MIRVLVAEDVRAIRETLVVLLGLEEGIEVAAAVTSGDQVMPAAMEHRPDVVLLDIGLPGLDGITVAEELTGQALSCEVLILTGREGPASLEAALGAGISGYLLKDVPAAVLIAAVRAVVRGERVIDARLAGRVPGWEPWPPQAF